MQWKSLSLTSYKSKNSRACVSRACVKFLYILKYIYPFSLVFINFKIYHTADYFLYFCIELLIYLITIMDKVLDKFLVDFRILKRTRIRENGVISRYYVLCVNGDEFYKDTIQGIFNTLIYLLSRDFCNRSIKNLRSNHFIL